MALKATIFKVDLSVADMDRNVYSDFALTLARHPSENDIRMMVRLFAFMRLADERLEFGKGLSTDEEPDLWLKDLTGAIDQWIVVGHPDERWLRKASGRAGKVFVFATATAWSMCGGNRTATSSKSCRISSSIA